MAIGASFAPSGSTLTPGLICGFVHPIALHCQGSGYFFAWTWGHYQTNYNGHNKIKPIFPHSFDHQFHQFVRIPLTDDVGCHMSPFIMYMGRAQDEDTREVRSRKETTMNHSCTHGGAGGCIDDEANESALARFDSK